jgi:large subunit ribosomal protein L29
MATAKKPVAKKAAPKKAETVKTVTDMKKELIAKRQDLLDAMKSHKAGELVNPTVLRSTRKEIARILTSLKLAEKNEQKESK